MLQSKFNIINGRYRKTSGSLRERRLHIAAAVKALSRADGLAKRRRSSLEGGSAGGPAFANDLVPGGHHPPMLSPGMYFLDCVLTRTDCSFKARRMPRPSSLMNQSSCYRRTA